MSRRGTTPFFLLRDAVQACGGLCRAKNEWVSSVEKCPLLNEQPPSFDRAPPLVEGVHRKIFSFDLLSLLLLRSFYISSHRFILYFPELSPSRNRPFFQRKNPLLVPLLWNNMEACARKKPTRPFFYRSRPSVPM